MVDGNKKEKSFVYNTTLMDLVSLSDKNNFDSLESLLSNSLQQLNDVLGSNEVSRDLKEQIIDDLSSAVQFCVGKIVEIDCGAIKQDFADNVMGLAFNIFE
jgi:hypothetical protein